MGLDRVALRDANLLIDDPDSWLREHGLENIWGLRHDDDRKFAMDVVRSILKDIHGDVGRLAADLHYVLDYIERWLDEKSSAWMLEKMQQRNLFPSKRYGFVHRYKRIWYPSYRENTIPITSYCTICKGVKRPINSPFCSECKANLANITNISPKNKFEIFLQAFAKKIEDREIDSRVVEFVGQNFDQIINAIIEDRRTRGLYS